MFERISVATPAGDNTLLFWKLSGTEQLSHSFKLEVSLLSTNRRLDRKAMLGQPIAVTIPTQGALRYLNGKITSVNIEDIELGGTHYAAYRLRMESDLWPMLRDRNQRIFQNLRAPDIIKTVLREYNVNVEDHLIGNYRNWEYCVQYQESSFNFISRLMELEGIYFWFKHEADRHTLMLMDSAYSHQPFSGYETIPYHATVSGGITDEEGIGQWAISERVTPGLYSLDDYDFRKPNAWLFQARQNPASPSPGEIDYYEWPGRFVDHSHGQFYARIRQEEWQAKHQRIKAAGTALGIAPGYRFRLGNPPFASEEQEYQVVSAAYRLQENSYASGGEESRHEIKFRVIPASVTWRSPQTSAWPRTHGPQTARVVGPEGKSIWTDKYGRIKVKFHWDRLAKGDDTSSCWVRVSSAWAGQGFGGVQIPRVNDEVVVDFINGDPDRPIVTGRVYNEARMPPWPLPAGATMMGFMTRSKGGHIDNSSHLFFEDRAGMELVHLHAEKDIKVTAENDKVEMIEGNCTIGIGGNLTCSVGGTLNYDVSGDASYHFQSKRTTTVEGIETKFFNGGEQTTIFNGRKMEVAAGGDNVTITGDRVTLLNNSDIHTVLGDKELNVCGLLTESFEAGTKTIIKAGGKDDFITGGKRVSIKNGKRESILGGKVEEIIDGDASVQILSGRYKQFAKSGVDISSFGKITISSNTEVKINAPEKLWVTNGYNINLTGFNAEINGFNLCASGVDVAYTPLQFSTVLACVKNSDMAYERKLIKIESMLQNVMIGLIHNFT
ncbi:type VI secretion system Vgr family protein [Kalamiella sp. sgz302252]|uniref:type VI secretion system Vgr family protein n=1 Tax=Pantoea sp. sgz302252 TaxID=3341827 RepID=UPI0036D3359A